MFLSFIQITNKFNYTRINMTKFTALISMEENIMVLYKMMHTPEDILGNKYALKVFTIFMTCVMCRMIGTFFIALFSVLGLLKYVIVCMVIKGLKRISKVPVPSRWQDIPVYPIQLHRGCSPGCLVCIYAFNILSDECSMFLTPAGNFKAVEYSCMLLL